MIVLHSLSLIYRDPQYVFTECRTKAPGDKIPFISKWHGRQKPLLKSFTTRTKPYPVFTHDMWVDTVLHLSLKPLQWGSTGHFTSMCVLFTRIGIIKTLGHAQVWFPLKHINNFFKHSNQIYFFNIYIIFDRMSSVIQCIRSITGNYLIFF